MFEPDPVRPLGLGWLGVEVDPHLPEVPDELEAAALEQRLRLLVRGGCFDAQPDLFGRQPIGGQLPRPFLDPIEQRGPQAAPAMFGKDTADRVDARRVAEAQPGDRDDASIPGLDDPSVAIEVNHLEERRQILGRVVVVAVVGVHRAHELDHRREVPESGPADAIAIPHHPEACLSHSE